MTSLIKIRFIQLKYELKHLGAVFALLLIFFFIAFEFFVYISFKKFPLNFSISVVSFFSWYHLTRKDISFINLHIANPRASICLEYLGFVLVFIIPALFTHNWIFFF